MVKWALKLAKSYNDGDKKSINVLKQFHERFDIDSKYSIENLERSSTYLFAPVTNNVKMENMGGKEIIPSVDGIATFFIKKSLSLPIKNIDNKEASRMVVHVVPIKINDNKYEIGKLIISNKDNYYSIDMHKAKNNEISFDMKQLNKDGTLPALLASGSHLNIPKLLKKPNESISPLLAEVIQSIMPPTNSSITKSAALVGMLEKMRSINYLAGDALQNKLIENGISKKSAKKLVKEVNGVTLNIMPSEGFSKIIKSSEKNGISFEQNFNNLARTINEKYKKDTLVLIEGSTLAYQDAGTLGLNIVKIMNILSSIKNSNIVSKVDNEYIINTDNLFDKLN